MTKLHDNSYIADKGKIFVITEKGKAECKSMSNYDVGEPWGDDKTWAPSWAIDRGELIEVDDPDFVRLLGYKAVYYNHNKYELSCGNPIVFFDREIAEKVAARWKKRPWNNGEKAYVVEVTYEGKRPEPCREYEGKRVYNRDWWFYDAATVGDLVDETVVDDAINALPPTCMRSNCMQMGEPSNYRVDENGNLKATYETFKLIGYDVVGKSVWMYCGDCFRGENIQHGIDIPYVA